MMKLVSDFKTAYVQNMIQQVGSIRESFSEVAIVWHLKRYQISIFWMLVRLFTFLVLFLIFNSWLKNLNPIEGVVLSFTGMFGFSFGVAGSMIIDRKKIIMNYFNENSNSVWIRYYLFQNSLSLITILAIDLSISIDSNIISSVIYTLIILIISYIAFSINYKLVVVILDRKSESKHNVVIWILATLAIFISYISVILRNISLINAELCNVFLLISLLFLVVTIIYTFLNFLKIKNNDLIFRLKVLDENIYKGVDNWLQHTKPQTRRLTAGNFVTHNIVKNYLIKDITSLLQSDAQGFWIRIVFGYVACSITLFVGFNAFSQNNNNIALLGTVVLAVLEVSNALASRCVLSSERTTIILNNNSNIIRNIINEKAILFTLLMLPFLIEVIIMGTFFKLNYALLMPMAIISVLSSVMAILLGDILFPKFKGEADTSVPTFQALIISALIYFMFISGVVYLTVHNYVLSIILMLVIMLLFLIQGKYLSKINIYFGEK